MYHLLSLVQTVGRRVLNNKLLVDHFFLYTSKYDKQLIFGPTIKLIAKQRLEEASGYRLIVTLTWPVSLQLDHYPDLSLFSGH